MTVRNLRTLRYLRTVITITFKWLNAYCVLVNRGRAVDYDRMNRLLRELERDGEVYVSDSKDAELLYESTRSRGFAGVTVGVCYRLTLPRQHPSDEETP